MKIARHHQEPLSGATSFIGADRNPSSLTLPDKPMDDQANDLLQLLSHSQLFRDYERAFGETVGLPLTLSPVDAWEFQDPGFRRPSPLRAFLSGRVKHHPHDHFADSAELPNSVVGQPRTVTGLAGLAETAIPLRLGDKLIGFLRTGEVLLEEPSDERCARLAEQLSAFGASVDEYELRVAMRQTKVLTPKQYESALQFLTLFSQHLVMVASQAAFFRRHAESPSISQAREFIGRNYGDALTLTDVANAVHMSTFYFCKKFKKATGYSFTQYLNRVRVEKAKQLLLNPHARVSEIAFDIGFQSLTHFNRVFHSLTGQSPTKFRSVLPHAA